ncbi:MAG TPA: AbrB/MazE/SpoVT family DNA-binding domain-containing protein [bacterium]|nr:AbrB/MazE/SpoVT family DNA-binding domain-containing protein [bacterium]
MLVSVVAIGNSKGIRLPKAILEQLHIQDQLEMEVEDKRLVLKPVNNKPRCGWEEAFKEMSANKEDSHLLTDDTASGTFEWQW